MVVFAATSQGYIHNVVEIQPALFPMALFHILLLPQITSALN